MLNGKPAPAPKFLNDKAWRGEAKGRFGEWVAKVCGISIDDAVNIGTWDMGRVATCRSWLKKFGAMTKAESQPELPND